MVRRALAVLGLAIAAAAAVVAVACGPSASNVPVLRESGAGCLPGYGCTDGGLTLDSGPITIPPEPLEDWDAAADGSLSGIFAVEATVTAQAGVTVTSKQLYRLRIAQSGTHIHQKTTLCDLSLPSTNIATLAIPPALQTLIQSRAVENDGDYLSSASVLEAQYLPPQFVEVLGASLANPATDPLPSIDAGAGATDDDNDGNPGVTLVAQVVTCTSLQELYVALRATGVLSGTVETPDLIKGYAQIHLNESVLGYSDPCLAAAAAISIVVEPDSPFRAQRVGTAEDVDHNGNVSCPEIVINAPNIFSDWSQ